MKTLRQLRAFLRRRKIETEMAEEMRLHLAQRTHENLERGLSPEEARFAAQRKFGGAEQFKERARDQRGGAWLDHFVRQIGFSARRLARTPGFTATALATLALCLGTNLAIFAVLDAILLRPLPFPDSGRLVALFNTYPKAGVMNDGSSITNYYERRGHLAAFSSLSLYREETAIEGPAGATDRVRILRISPEFFATLGVGLANGRPFAEEETSFAGDKVAILSDAYWRQRFAADPQVLGREVRVDGVARKIVGVLPPDFRFLSTEARLYLPLSSSLQSRTAAQRHSGGGAIKMIARLGAGASLAEAQAQVDAHNAAVSIDDPSAKQMADAGFRTRVVALHADQVAAIRPMLWLVQAGALFLLAIGVVNLVNLLLIRAGARAKELAVRQALGASRRHLVEEVLTETTLLAIAGGVLGLAVGASGIGLLAAWGAERLPLGAQIAFDGRLAAVALLGSGLLGVVLGLPVAWLGRHTHLTDALQSESRGGTAGPKAQRLRHAFIVAQIALAFILLAAAGLLGTGLRQVMAISPGFRAGQVLTGRISLPGRTYPTTQARLAFLEKLLGEIGRRPGVMSAGIATNIPFSGQGGKAAATVAGHVMAPGESLQGIFGFGVDGDYFTALGLPLRAGRFLTAADSRNGLRSCVVDEAFARRFWPDGDGIGRRLFQGGQAGNDDEAFTVVGIVGAARQADLAETELPGTVYYPFRDRAEGDVFVVLRVGGPPSAFAPLLQGVVRGLDPELPVSDLQSMETRIDDSLLVRRSPALLAGIFAGGALLLTAVGTYGVLSYAVAQRRREIGVRIALGARPDQIRRQFLAIGFRLFALGLAGGLVGATLAGQVIHASLAGLPALHLPTLLSAAALLGAIALAALWLPARRAAKIDPVIALRCE